MEVHKEIAIHIYPTPDDHDSDNVQFTEGKRIVGRGYRGKRSNLICVTYCPMCQRENYALVIAQGVCAWCSFDPNRRNENAEVA